LESTVWISLSSINGYGRFGILESQTLVSFAEQSSGAEDLLTPVPFNQWL
jgi:hypothetical protein